MKKLISILLACMLLTTALPLSASAYQIGDVVGYALATDIVATINGYDIPSYNVDGYTYVIVEDLRYYGFSVNYNNATRSLSVTRDFSQMYVSNDYQKPYISPEKIGTIEYQILFTDIVTYLDGNYVHTFNINGQTIICFDELSAYGSVLYDNSIREISAIIPGIATNPYPTDRTKIQSQDAATLLNMLSGTWVSENESYDTGVPFMDFHGNNLDRGWSYDYYSYGSIKNVTPIGNNTYKIDEELTIVNVGDEDFGTVIDYEFYIYYEGGNRFKEIWSDGTTRSWKYVGTIEDMLNIQ